MSASVIETDIKKILAQAHILSTQLLEQLEENKLKHGEILGVTQLLETAYRRINSIALHKAKTEIHKTTTEI